MSAKKEEEKDAAGAPPDLRALLEKAVHDRRDPRLRAQEEEADDGVRAPAAAQRSVERRRCANCTCSRSTEAKPKSACGNCGLGDAFRCAGCPYKGMPAFKDGEEVRFEDLGDDI